MRIKFCIPNAWNNYLFQILKGIESEDYIWKIGDGEILYYKKGVYELFAKRIYDGKSFFNRIQQEHYPIFADIRLYKTGGNLDFEIINYSDFLKSDCLLALFINDNEWVDIYCKDDKLTKIIYNNAIESGFSNIELIASNENVRKYFSAYYSKW